MTTEPAEFHERSPHLFRLMAFATGLATLILGILSAYWLARDILPLFGRLLRDAPIVVTPYLAFMLIAMCTVTPIVVVTSLHACWRAQKFDPSPQSRMFRFQRNSYKLTVWSMIFISPALAVLVTLALCAKGYTPCQKLLISGSAWRVYWVNDARYCFKPDFYNSDEQPCKHVGNRTLCTEGGRQ